MPTRGPLSCQRRSLYVNSPLPLGPKSPVSGARPDGKSGLPTPSPKPCSQDPVPQGLLPEVSPCDSILAHPGPLTWLFLARFGKVGDTCVRAHQDIAGMQCTLKKALLGFRDVDSPERSFGQSVGGDQGKAVHADLMDTVYCLKGKNTGTDWSIQTHASGREDPTSR